MKGEARARLGDGGGGVREKIPERRLAEILIWPASTRCARMFKRRRGAEAILHIDLAVGGKALLVLRFNRCLGCVGLPGYCGLFRFFGVA